MSLRPHIPAVILAGGRATRMGGEDKALMLLDGQTLIARVADRLRPQCAVLAVNANGPPGRFDALRLTVLPDEMPGFPGPLAGLLAALEWAAAQGHDQVLTAPVDTPFLPADLAHRLIEAAGPTGLAMAASRDDKGSVHDHPTCALWPVRLRAELRAALAAGDRRMRAFILRYDPGHAVWQAGAFDPFFNVNAPGDLARAGDCLRQQDGRGPAG